MLDRDLRIAVNTLIDSIKEKRPDETKRAMDILNQLLGNETAKELYGRIKRMLFED